MNVNGLKKSAPFSIPFFVSASQGNLFLALDNFEYSKNFVIKKFRALILDVAKNEENQREDVSIAREKELKINELSFSLSKNFTLRGGDKEKIMKDNEYLRDFTLLARENGFYVECEISRYYYRAFFSFIISVKIAQDGSILLLPNNFRLFGWAPVQFSSFVIYFKNVIKKNLCSLNIETLFSYPFIFLKSKSYAEIFGLKIKEGMNNLTFTITDGKENFSDSMLDIYPILMEVEQNKIDEAIQNLEKREQNYFVYEWLFLLSINDKNKLTKIQVHDERTHLSILANIINASILLAEREFPKEVYSKIALLLQSQNEYDSLKLLYKYLFEHYFSSDKESALSVLSTIVSLFPDDFYYASKFATLLFSAGRARESISVRKRLVKDCIEKEILFSNYLAIGDYLKGEGNYHEAATNYKKALELFPLSFPCLFKLSDLYIIDKNFSCAILLFDSYLARSDLNAHDRAQIFFQRGKILDKNLKKTNEAYQNFEESLKLDPASLPCHKEFVNLFINEGNLKKAIPSLVYLVKKSNNPAQWASMLSDYYYNRNNELSLYYALATFSAKEHRTKYFKRIVEMAEREGMKDLVVNVLYEYIDYIKDQKNKLEYFCDLTRLAILNLGKDYGAKIENEIYKILLLDFFCEQAHELLLLLFSINNDWNKILAFYQKMIPRASTKEERSFLFYKLAYIISEKMNDKKRALTFLSAGGMDFKKGHALELIISFLMIDEIRNESLKLVEDEFKKATDLDGKLNILIKLKDGIVDKVNRKELIEILKKFIKFEPPILVEIHKSSKFLPHDLLFDLTNDLLATLPSDLKIWGILRLAEISYKNIGDFGRALPLFEKALIISVSTLDEILSAKNHFLKENKIDEAADLLKICIKYVKSNSLRSLLALELSRVAFFLQRDRNTLLEFIRLSLSASLDNYPIVRNIRNKILETGDYDTAVMMLKIESELIQHPILKSKIYFDLGEILRRVNNKEAIKAIEMALFHNNASFESLYSASRISRELALFERAIEFLFKIRDLLVKHKYSLNLLLIYYEISLLYKECKNYDKSARYLKELLKIDNKNPDAWLMLIDIEIENDNFDRATNYIEDHRRFISESDTLALNRNRMKLAILYQRMNRFQDAERVYNEIVRRDEFFCDGLVGLSDLLFELNRVNEAIDNLSGFITKKMGKNERIKILERLLIYSKKLNELPFIFKISKMLNKIDPRNAAGCNALLSCYREMKDWDNLIEMLTAMIKNEANSENRVKLMFDLADIFRDKKRDLKRAVDIYEEILSLKPSNVEQLEHLIRIFIESEDVERIVKLSNFFDDFKELSPIVCNARKSIGERLLKFPQYAEIAIKNLKSIEKDSEDRVNLAKKLASLYRTKGKIRESLDEYLSILNEDPFDIEILQNAMKSAEELSFFEMNRSISQIYYLLTGDKGVKEEIEKNKKTVLSKEKLNTKIHESLIEHPFKKSPLSDIFSIITPILLDLFPSDIESYDVGKSDILDKDSKSSIKILFDEATEFLSCPPFSLYVSSKCSLGIFIEIGEPFSVVFNSELLKLFNESELRFIVARNLEHLRSGHIMARKFELSDLDLFLSILSSELLFTPIEKKEETESEFPHKYKKKFLKFIKGEIGDALTAKLRKFKESKISLRDWIDGMEHTANRAGFVYSKDLISSVYSIIRFDRRFSRVKVGSFTEIEKICKQSNQIRELFLFSLSKEYFNFKRGY